MKIKKPKQTENLTFQVFRFFHGSWNVSVSYHVGPAEIVLPRGQKFRAMNRAFWQAQLGESLVMLIGPSWALKFIALLGTKFEAIRERRCLP